MLHYNKESSQEQAYKDFAQGKFQNESADFNKLMKKYTSEISPDRKGIITSGLKAVAKSNQNVLQPMDLIAAILEGKVRYQKLPSGKSEYMEFYDKNGEMRKTVFRYKGMLLVTVKVMRAHLM